MKKPTSLPSGIAASMTAAAAACGVTTRTMRDLRAEGLPGFRTDNTVDLSVFWAAFSARKKTRVGSSSLKDKKTKEEIRKLKLVNDQRAGRLIERAWMAERIYVAAGIIDAARLKSEAEHPMRFAAAEGDPAKCREILRGIWDDIAIALNGMKEAFRAKGPNA